MQHCRLGIDYLKVAGIEPAGDVGPESEPGAMAPKKTIRGEKAKLTALRENQAKLIEALQVLYTLLEAYAPSWYTEEHHRLAASALSLVP
jgi:hypothetical protein